jgi:hypothetical protein
MVRMTRFYDDPTLEELLGDSMTQAIIKADRVDRRKLEAMLRTMAREIAGDSGGSEKALVEPEGGPSDRSAASALLRPTATLRDQAASCCVSGSRIRSQRRVAS